MLNIAGTADIGGTNTRVALIREDGTILALKRFTTPHGSDPGAIPATVKRILLNLMESAGIGQICGIGVSVAGPVDLVYGSISHPPNMPFDLVPITDPLRQSFGLPVVLMNDCRAAVLGEVFAGAGKGYQHLVYITFSTGIGGGVYSGGQVLMGRGGNAGEIGHFPVDTTYQHPCSCGHAGHWEGYASGGSMPGFFQAWCRVHDIIPRFPGTTADEILSAAAGKVPEASSFIQELAGINARGLSTVIVAYDPEIIILDGPVITTHQDIILPPALACLDRYLAPPKIVISQLKGNAPLLGVAAGVFSHIDTHV